MLCVAICPKWRTVRASFKYLSMFKIAVIITRMQLFLMEIHRKPTLYTFAISMNDSEICQKKEFVFVKYSNFCFCGYGLVCIVHVSEYWFSNCSTDTRSSSRNGVVFVLNCFF